MADMEQHAQAVAEQKRIRQLVRDGGSLSNEEATVLLRTLMDYESAICFDTSCLNCAHLLDQLVAAEAKLEELPEWKCPSCGAVTRAQMADNVNEAVRAERLHAALTELVTLKDGPRGEDYERRKPLAWQAARDLLQPLPSHEELVAKTRRILKLKPGEGVGFDG